MSRRLARALTLLAWLSAPWSGVALGGLRPTDLFLGLAFPVAILTARGQYRHPLALRYLAGLGLIVLGAFLGALTAWVDVPSVSLVAVRAGLVALPLLVLLALRADTAFLRRCAVAFVLGTAVLVLSGVVMGLTPNSGRLRGWSVHPNQVAMTCVMSVAFLGLLRRRLAQFLVLGVLLFGISASGSRSGVVALLAVVGIAGLRYSRSWPTWRAVTVGALAVVGMAVGLTSYDDSRALARLVGSDTTVSVSDRHRQELYDQTIKDVSAQRLVLGGEQFEDVDRPHSIVLEVTMSDGLTGLAGLLLLFVPPLFWLFRHPLSSVTSVACLATLAYIVNVAFNNALWARFAWCVLSLAYAAEINERRRGKTPNSRTPKAGRMVLAGTVGDTLRRGCDRVPGSGGGPSGGVAQPQEDHGG